MPSTIVTVCGFAVVASKVRAVWDNDSGVGLAVGDGDGDAVGDGLGEGVAVGEGLGAGSRTKLL